MPFSSFIQQPLDQFQDRQHRRHRVEISAVGDLGTVADAFDVTVVHKGMRDSGFDRGARERQPLPRVPGQEELVELAAGDARLAQHADTFASRANHDRLRDDGKRCCPRSNSRSSTFRKLNGKRTYSITTRLMTSSDELK